MKKIAITLSLVSSITAFASTYDSCQTSFDNISSNIVEVEMLQNRGEIDDTQAEILTRMHKKAGQAMYRSCSALIGSEATEELRREAFLNLEN